MRFVIAFLGCILLHACLVNAIIVSCYFSLQSWANMGSVYTCSVSDLSISSRDTEVTEIYGSHIDGHDNGDVKKLNIHRENCKYIPKGFEKFFPNLEGLRVAQSGLISIQQSDLSVHPNLRNCDMFNNDLTVLEKDLFAKNPKLEYLYFGDNRIESVGHDILAPLHNLHTAVFQGNKCTKRNAYSRDDIEDLQKILNRECGWEVELETTTRDSEYETSTPQDSDEYPDSNGEHGRWINYDDYESIPDLELDEYGLRNDTSEDDDEYIQGNGYGDNDTISRDDFYDVIQPRHVEIITPAILALIALIAVTLCIAVLCVIKTRRSRNAKRNVVHATSVGFKTGAPVNC